MPNCFYVLSKIPFDMMIDFSAIPVLVSGLKIFARQLLVEVFHKETFYANIYSGTALFIFMGCWLTTTFALPVRDYYSFKARVIIFSWHTAA